MNLHDYLSSLSSEAKDVFAKKAGTKKIYLIQIAGGHSTPSPALCIRIEAASDRMVSRYDLRTDADDIWPREVTPPTHAPTA